MKIGNIVSHKSIEVGEEFNIVDSLDKIIQGIPTLIVGHHIVKETYGTDIDFIDRQIEGEDEIHWTFTIEELRKYYVVDIEEFVSYCFEKAVSKITYVYVDPIQFKLGKMKKVIKKIKSLDKPISYFHDENMIYVFGENIIFGIDLKLIRFLGIDVKKIKTQLKTISKVVLSGNEILIEYKDSIERLGEQPKFIPFLFSISKHE